MKIKENLAKIVSFGFSPTITLTLVLLIILLKTGLTNPQLRTILPLIILIDIILPAFIWFFSLEKHFISDWEITRREERGNLYIIFSLLFFLGTAICFIFGNSFITRLYFIFSLTFFLATIITFFWKISIHMVIDTLVVVLLTVLFPGLWFLYLLLPLVAWSRYECHRHTPTQLTAGFALAILISFLLLP